MIIRHFSIFRSASRIKTRCNCEVRRAQGEAVEQDTGQSHLHAINELIPCIAGGNVGCFNKNQSVPAVFYNATVQRITFHTPSDHLVFGTASFYPTTLSVSCLVPVLEVPEPILSAHQHCISH